LFVDMMNPIPRFPLPLVVSLGFLVIALLNT
jgi:hypothetical protein